MNTTLPELRSMIMLAGHPFSHGELRAMEHQGIIREVLPGTFVGAAQPDTAAIRAGAAAVIAGPRMGPHGIIGRRSAAWVYGCWPMPTELEVLVARYHRPNAQVPLLKIKLSESAVDDTELCMLGGVAVTSPLRTATDVAFNSPPDAARSILAAMDGIPRLGCRLETVRDAVALFHRRPGRIRALALVDKLIDATPERTAA
ncbi:type IV toxin-antitoxin system AbiEi family antitoxin [Paeniglutamicibacter cryotolerans]|uniref:AbiEi antitoxin C-terminal domain-containing protein n=1 Tax=Paeniglutamicibacter cryotolerans TaxID=670079 RepID=A0A839QYT2_9MICC|nr:hypothetical protein [Paeniglutamicibacter cryotolerans]MBB2997121.1 hypothetical protein [Paeniglutamicibacter cryotolerans]